MLKRRAILAFGLAAGLTGTAVAAPVAKRSNTETTPASFVGSGHVPQLDGALTTLSTADGRTFAVWAYRASGEFDIAVSARDADSALWTAPVFFGRGNGTDDIQPAITVDSLGTVYVAYATGIPSRVSVVALPANAASWTTAVTVSGSAAASSPSLMIVHDRLVIAFRTVRGASVVAVPTIGAGGQIEGIQDGPDGVDPLGHKNRSGNYTDYNVAPGEPRNP